MKITAFAGLALACLSMGACNTLGGLTGAPGIGSAPQKVLDDLDRINEAAAKNCRGTAGIHWNPPLPPTGNLNIDCYIGQTSPFTPAGGNFGGGGATGAFGDGSSVILTLPEYKALLQSAKSAADAPVDAAKKP
jgi:hypothetical protein